MTAEAVPLAPAPRAGRSPTWTPTYFRVELNPLRVIAYGLGPDGLYREVAHAESGQQLVLGGPFPFSLDPSDLLR